jgi:hypothetical protein
MGVAWAPQRPFGGQAVASWASARVMLRVALRTRRRVSKERYIVWVGPGTKGYTLSAATREALFSASGPAAAIRRSA